MAKEHSHSDSGPAVRFHLLGDGDQLVVFDAGLLDCNLTWSAVIPEIADIARVLLVDRNGYPDDLVPDDPAEAGAIALQIKTTSDPNSFLRRIVLVGCSSGASAMSGVASIVGPGKSVLILIDPILTAGGVTREELRRLQGIPLTLIFPGTQLQSTHPEALETQIVLQQLLDRASTIREIIAGRSSECIPIERPDVVIDAIIYYLDTTNEKFPTRR